MTDEAAIAFRNDVFAEIAAQRRASRGKHLIRPQPAKCKPRILPAMKSAKTAGPKRNRVDTPEKLERALADSRRRHAKFLVNHAPALPLRRASQFLEKFDWRLETPADRADFAALSRGEGEWAPVTLPHFGPPEGRATAYYRASFELAEEMIARGAIFVRFRGVDYKAHVFINGSYLGSHEGFFAPFEFECTPHIRPGTNTLLVKVENDAIMMGNSSWDGPGSRTEGDKLYGATGPGYDDPEVGWHHCPPGMGIYQPVCIESRTRVHISDLFVRPLPEQGKAEAWLEVFNCAVTASKVSLELSVCGRNFRQSVLKRLAWRPSTIRIPGLGDMSKPGDNELVELDAGPGVNYFKVPFDLPRHRSWTPATPWLYQIQVELLDDGGDPLDAAERQFGMRSFRIDESSATKGTLLLNEVPIRLRGANTMGFEQLCVMRGQWDRLRDDILLAKLANMNFLRLTQRPVQEEVYDWCDRLGLLTQTDLPLFGCLRRNQFAEAVRQAGEMERLVRSHPCNILISYINEPFPNANGNPCRHLTRLELGEFFKAADIAVRQSNPDRAIKPVDGDYDPPAPGLPDVHCYNGWYLANGVDLGELHKGYWQQVKPGWNYACGEFGSEGIDPENTMRRYYPADWLPRNSNEESSWTPDRIKKSQTGSFHYLWFETPNSLAEWIRRSQAHQAWITKLTVEAFRRDWRMVSFAIHLFIDAFPAGWMKAIMDVDRQPKPAYFAYREALSPLMVSFRSDRWAYFGGEQGLLEAWICNDRHETSTGARLCYSAVLGGRTVLAGQAEVAVPSFTSVLAGLIPVAIPAVSAPTTLTMRLALLDRSGIVVHDNELSLKVFPRRAAKEFGMVRILGRPGGPAERLARELGLKSGRVASTILIDHYHRFQNRWKNEVRAAVQAGAKAVFLELPPGIYEIGGDRMTVSLGTMGPCHFVSRATGHPAVAGFTPDDFKFWYERATDRPTPILRSVFDVEGWRPILTSGTANGGSGWKRVLAAAEKRDGHGSWCVCQVQLAGRIEGNPVAEIFARRLIAPESAGCFG